LDTAETALSGLVDYRTWGKGVVCIVGSNPTPLRAISGKLKGRRMAGHK
jgi:hypothetical protein